MIRKSCLLKGIVERSDQELCGRNDRNIKVIFPKEHLQGRGVERDIQPGDYVAVKIVDGSSQVLRGEDLYHTTLQSFSSWNSVSKLRSSPCK